MRADCGRAMPRFARHITSAFDGGLNRSHNPWRAALPCGMGSDGLKSCRGVRHTVSVHLASCYEPFDQKIRRGCALRWLTLPLAALPGANLLPNFISGVCQTGFNSDHDGPKARHDHKPRVQGIYLLAAGGLVFLYSFRLRPPGTVHLRPARLRPGGRDVLG